MKTNQNMTEGPLGKQILYFSVPLMFSNILQVLFNMSDIAVVGQFSGPEALGSVGSTAILVVLFTGLLIGMGSGVNVLVAQFYGAKKEDSIREMVHTSCIVCLLTGILVLLAGILSARFLLELLHTKDVLIDGASLYLHIYFLGMPALVLYNFGNGVLSAVGDTKRPLIYLSISGVLNVLLNMFFVIVCNMSVAGVATASVISQYVSAFFILAHLFRCQECYKLSFSCFHVNKCMAKKLLSIGIPAGIQNAIFQFANLFIQAGVNSFSAVLVEGNSAATNADALVYDVMAAFYTACSSFMGQNYGAHNRKRVLKSYFISLAYSFGFGSFLGLLLVFFGRQFLSLFTSHKEVIDAGMQRLSVMGLSYGFSAFMDCSIAACRGLGKTIVPTIIVIMGSCVFRIIWIYTIFAYFGTIFSLYILYIFSWGITAIAETLYFYYCYRKLLS